MRHREVKVSDGGHCYTLLVGVRKCLAQRSTSEHLESKSVFIQFEIRLNVPVNNMSVMSSIVSVCGTLTQ